MRWIKKCNPYTCELLYLIIIDKSSKLLHRMKTEQVSDHEKCKWKATEKWLAREQKGKLNFRRWSDINSKKPPKAAWPMVCLPKEEDGLGVLNITVQNESLLLKHLHKIYNRALIPWVQLVWDKYLQEADYQYRGPPLEDLSSGGIF